LTAAVPIIFGKSHELFGWYHLAAQPCRNCAVVLSNPLGYEAFRVHRAYRHLAARLSDAGFAVLRFDHWGTGDSAGESLDTPTIRPLLDGIADALDEIRERSGASESAIVGVRMGATLGAIVGSARGGVSSMVLWAACPSGAAYLREMRVVARALRVDSTKEALTDVACFDLPPSAAAELSLLSLVGLSLRPTNGALVVPREEPAPVDAKIADALQLLGTDVHLRAVGGYSEMMRDSHESRVPQTFIDDTVEWLSLRHPKAASTRCREAVSRGPSGLAIRETSSSFGVTEVPVHFGEGRRLFGIVTRPDSPELDGRLGFILTSVGALHRVGPGRLYVHLARRLARLGAVALRFDLSGIGDSAAPPGGGENALYEKGAPNDVRAAMDYLAESAGVNRFVLVGICAGGYVAYLAGVSDPRVTGLVAINVPTFRWKEGARVETAIERTVHSSGYYGRGLLRSVVWRRLLQGDVHTGAILHTLGQQWASRLSTQVRWAASIVRGRSGASDVAADLLRLCDRGTRVTLAYGEDEAGLDEARMHLGTSPRLSAHARFRLAVVPGVDHTFTGGQDELMAVLAPYVDPAAFQDPSVRTRGGVTTPPCARHGGCSGPSRFSP
jgi:alpha-beta hydrolase superfamily lysophospholipase